MKQGNQFYLEFQIEDENGNLLDVASVLKVQFTIGDLIKTYDGENKEFSDKVYAENGKATIELPENEADQLLHKNHGVLRKALKEFQGV